MSKPRLSLDQLSDYRQLTAERDALWSKLAAAMTSRSAADAMANAIDAYYAAMRALAFDDAQVVSVARALVRIEDALKAYRAARKGESDG